MPDDATRSQSGSRVRPFKLRWSRPDGCDHMVSFDTAQSRDLWAEAYRRLGYAADTFDGGPVEGEYERALQYRQGCACGEHPAGECPDE